MRILQIFNQYRFHGGEEAWVDAIPKLLGNAVEIDELRFSSRAWIGDHSPCPLQQIQWIGDNPASRAELRERVAEFRPDVLLVHNVIPVGSLGLYQEARLLGVPIIQYIHNFRPFSPSATMWLGDHVNDAALRGNPWPEIIAGAWQGSRLKTAILAWHLAHARRNGLIDHIDHWLAISDFMRDRFIEAGISPDRITTLRHCHTSGAQPTPIEEADHYLYLGRLVGEKGCLDLVHAWRILEKQLGENCPKLVIAGAGPEEDRMKQLSAGHRTISFTGHVEGSQKSQWIGSCRALLVPSIWWEPLGLTAYEAYAAARPVIAARSGALQETVINGQTGWLHEPGNVQAIVDAVMRAEAAGRGERDRLGVAASKWLSQMASPSKWRDQFLQVVDHTIEHSRSDSRSQIVLSESNNF